MALFGSLLAVLLAAFAGLCAWLLRTRRLALGNWIGVVALGAWCLGVAIKLYVDHSRRDGAVESIESIAWPSPASSPLVSPAPAPVPTAAGVQAEPVAALIGGLEARLEEHPEDAEGWALLAQSYAFVANEEAIEPAVQRAVALGVDEQMLRERVERAERSAHPTDWVERAIGASR
jgi:predicted Zn-dependent protease